MEIRTEHFPISVSITTPRFQIIPRYCQSCDLISTICVANSYCYYNYHHNLDTLLPFSGILFTGFITGAMDMEADPWNAFYQGTISSLFYRYLSSYFSLSIINVALIQNLDCQHPDSYKVL